MASLASDDRGYQTMDQLDYRPRRHRSQPNKYLVASVNVTGYALYAALAALTALLIFSTLASGGATAPLILKAAALAKFLLPFTAEMATAGLAVLAYVAFCFLGAIGALLEEVGDPYKLLVHAFSNWENVLVTFVILLANVFGPILLLIVPLITGLREGYKAAWDVFKEGGAALFDFHKTALTTLLYPITKPLQLINSINPKTIPGKILYLALATPVLILLTTMTGGLIEGTAFGATTFGGHIATASSFLLTKLPFLATWSMGQMAGVGTAFMLYATKYGAAGSRSLSDFIARTDGVAIRDASDMLRAFKEGKLRFQLADKNIPLFFLPEDLGPWGKALNFLLNPARWLFIITGPANKLFLGSMISFANHCAEDPFNSGIINGLLLNVGGIALCVTMLPLVFVQGFFIKIFDNIQDLLVSPLSLVTSSATKPGYQAMNPEIDYSWAAYGKSATEFAHNVGVTLHLASNGNSGQPVPAPGPK